VCVWGAGNRRVHPLLKHEIRPPDINDLEPHWQSQAAVVATGPHGHQPPPFVSTQISLSSPDPQLCCGVGHLPHPHPTCFTSVQPNRPAPWLLPLPCLSEMQLHLQDMSPRALLNGWGCKQGGRLPEGQI
jgi:hypothetical protein